MYTEEAVTDTISARDTGHIEIRVSNRVLKDGNVISTTYQRKVLAPGDDVTGEDAKVQAVASAVWTTEVVAAYSAAQAAATPE